MGAARLFLLPKETEMYRLLEFLKDQKGDMAEKAAVWALILIAAIGAFAILGGKIAAAVMDVANHI